MTTRTKIGVCVGAIVLVAVGSLLYSLPSRQGRMIIDSFHSAKPEVTMSFVRYIALARPINPRPEGHWPRHRSRAKPETRRA
jgi:hypothetical protein